MGLFSMFRANTITPEIINLINSGRKETILRNVYFEAALEFALEHGAKLEHGTSKIYTNSIGFIMNIDGKNYHIYFAKERDGSTYLGIDDADEAQRQFQERLYGK